MNKPTIIVDKPTAPLKIDTNVHAYSYTYMHAHTKHDMGSYTIGLSHREKHTHDETDAAAFRYSSRRASLGFY